MAELPVLDAATRPVRRSVWRDVARYAAARDGIVTHAELLAFGISRSAIARAARDGALFRLHQGVYLVGRPGLTRRGRHRAALCATGPQSHLAAFAACEHWELLDGEGVRLDVVSRRKLRSRDGIRVHWARHLGPGETTVHRGLAVTTVPRTLLDMASLVSDRRLMALCARAGAIGRYDRLAILALLGRGRHGSTALRRVLATLDVGEGHTREEFEHAFRRLIARHQITPPHFNDRLQVGSRSIVPDAHWREHGFVVELDSRRFHDNGPAFHTDREKDLVYEELGLDCLRLTWRHVVGDEARVAAVLRRRVGPPGRG